MKKIYIIVIIILILCIKYIKNKNNIESMQNNSFNESYTTFKKNKNKLSDSKKFEPKYIYDNENVTYINQFDKSRDKPNIDPLYKENKIIANNLLFLTNNNTNIIPLFLTLNDYNIVKGSLNKNIIDPIF